MHPHTKSYQTVFFDLDGTLTDPKEGITKSIQFAFEKMGLLTPSIDELEWSIGLPLQDIFAKLLNTHSETVINNALAYYRERYAALGMYENIPYSGVEFMLSELCKEGYHLYIATSKPEVFALEILKHFGLSHYFEKIYGAELDGTRSNKKYLLKYILESRPISQPCLMVGDRNVDAFAAFHNNMDALGVLYGYGSKQELTDAGVHHLCESPLDVYEWIKPKKSCIFKASLKME